jgi:hypothetical protein
MKILSIKDGAEIVLRKAEKNDTKNLIFSVKR